MPKNKLKEADYNPRYITEEDFKSLEENLKELGDLGGIVHDINSGFIISGNQRSKVFDINECEIEIEKEYDHPTSTGTIAQGFIIWEGERFSYRQVDWTEDQCKKANITANKIGGNWDWDVLANSFDMEDLIDWGFEESDFFGSEDTEEEEGQDPDDVRYTGKIEIPNYEPKKEKPNIEDLFDDTKTKELINRIKNSSLPEDEKIFLMVAAQRHTVIRYDRVADYYAHAGKEAQELFEDSALVIIDFDKALEKGYISLAEGIKEQFSKEGGAIDEDEE